MKDLLKYLPLLKAGASKENYPLYAQYMAIEEGLVRTCNDEAYVEVKVEMPFDGNVNLFVLETILKTLPDEYRINLESDMVWLLGNKEKYELRLSDLELPKLVEPGIEGALCMDEGILEILQTAQRFTGMRTYEPIYIDNEGIIAACEEKVMLYRQKLALTKPVMLTKNIIGVLLPNYYIGAEANDNTVITFPEGFAVFVTPHYSNFPAEKIREYSVKELENTLRLCSMETFRALITKVMPIFFGEAKRIITVNNYNGVIEITAESPFNGKAQAQGTSDIDFEWITTIDADLFNAVPDSYELHIREDSKNIMAKNHVAEAILLGD